MAKSNEQPAHEASARKINLTRDELIRRMDEIRKQSRPSSGQAIIDEIRYDRDNDLGRNQSGLDE
jgi:hypothetical protein